MPSYFIGVDLAGVSQSNTHVVVLKRQATGDPLTVLFTGAGAQVAPVGQRTSFRHDDVLLKFLTEPHSCIEPERREQFPRRWTEVVLAVDAPFSWPESFRDLLAPEGMAVDPGKWGEVEVGTHWRETEVQIQPRIGQWPKNSLSTELGQVAARCMSLLRRLGWAPRISGPQGLLDGEFRCVIEVYPKATSVLLGLAAYAAERAECDALIVDPNTEHERDALLAAYTAVMWTRDECEPAPADPDCSREGWILAPRTR